MNTRMIGFVLGRILLTEAGLLVLPAITAALYGEILWPWAATILLTALCGVCLSRTKPARTALYAKDGFVTVALAWLAMSAFGALPFVLNGDIPHYIDAFFETVSGFTTTGASILTAVEPLSRGGLFWRSFTHWVGGMGVLVFIMAFVPLSGGQNMHIMKAESPGPSVSKLVPRVKTTAMILYSIYFVLTFAEFIALLIGGMRVFDALNTAFSTAGTGGFGFRNDSFASFSPALQIIVTVFMLIFSINFSSYYLLITGKLKDAFNSELKVFALIVISAITVITLNIRHLFPSVGDALRNASFTVASIVSTTGFSTADFDLWPELSRTILVLIMFIGACAGSTGGGIKVSRIIILFKSMAKELSVMIHPKQVRKITVDSHAIDHETVRSVNVYMVCYIMVFVISMGVMSFDNYDLITNFTAVAATLNNVGPGLELVGPTQNFGFMSSPAKIILIFDMLAGRLELFPMLLLFAPATWKK